MIKKLIVTIDNRLKQSIAHIGTAETFDVPLDRAYDLPRLVMRAGRLSGLTGSHDKDWNPQFDLLNRGSRSNAQFLGTLDAATRIVFHITRERDTICVDVAFFTEKREIASFRAWFDLHGRGGLTSWNPPQVQSHFFRRSLEAA